MRNNNYIYLSLAVWLCDFFKTHWAKMRFDLEFASRFFYFCDYYHILKKHKVYDKESDKTRI